MDSQAGSQRNEEFGAPKIDLSVLGVRGEGPWVVLVWASVKKVSLWVESEELASIYSPRGLPLIP